MSTPPIPANGSTSPSAPIPAPPPTTSRKAWASLITNLDYLPGLLLLHHTLTHAARTTYPLIALYTPATFPASGLSALHRRGIRTRPVDPLLPASAPDYGNDPRFADTWTKLVVFGLEEFDVVGLLDGDMLVRGELDALLDVPLDDPAETVRVEDGEAGGGGGGGVKTGRRVFAACHACVCNPYHKPHYPKDWTPSACAYTSQHATPTLASTTPSPVHLSHHMPNSGLLIVRPSPLYHSLILRHLRDPATASYIFPDQNTLVAVFGDAWVPLPYVYNALKTMRREEVHGRIWRDGDVRVVHYIFGPKPWAGPCEAGRGEEVLWEWWREADAGRRRLEEGRGVGDGW